MIKQIKVKNLALMDDVSVEPGKGLNVFTGETGAGKSLLLGSIGLILGSRTDSGLIAKDCDSASVEIIFEGINPETEAVLIREELEVTDEIVLSRKISPGKSSCRVNGEMVSLNVFKEISSTLCDIHGQHDNVFLLDKKNHMEVLDNFIGIDAENVLAEYQDLYKAYLEAKNKLESENRDSSTMKKEADFAAYELEEIENAALKPGEDEELEAEYKMLSNGSRIAENISEAYEYTGENNASSAVSRALRAVDSVLRYDSRLENISKYLSDIEEMLGDVNNEISEYLSDMDDYAERLQTVEERLNIINKLKTKYGSTIEKILDYAREKKEFIQKCENYEDYIAGLERELKKAANDMETMAGVLSALRAKGAASFDRAIKETLPELNFAHADFKTEIVPCEYNKYGAETIEFMVSLNYGEELKPLRLTASGGELSRIELAIKSINAAATNPKTLVFDEIDAGISGVTASQVAKKLSVLSKNNQILCITHLPQIAAAGTTHFLIEKSVVDEHTKSNVTCLGINERVTELARMLGGAESAAALENAKELLAHATVEN